MTPDDEKAALARACADAMWANDRACQELGMAIDEVGPGYARVSMTVVPGMANGHNCCHGGYIFMLADSAFAYACNASGDQAVASSCSITYLRPGFVGDRLTAIAHERARAGRSGIYDVQITRADGTVLGEFRGHSRVIGSFFPAESTPAPSDRSRAGVEPRPGGR